ncbi:MAG: phenylalanine--tRNA ligase subunit alpha [Deltaproteobacteria bacterium]|jgi:phenylalanyl-tRNA synthetase alpha chain|nr:phenylalanine--tRNA ligase subunit alpha [Deltaproteobacteria bacterium]
MLTESIIEHLKQEAEQEIKNATSLSEIERLRVAYNGKKGKLTAWLKELGGLDVEARKVLGAKLNLVKEEITSNLENKTLNIQKAESSARYQLEKIDVTLPVKAPVCGLEPAGLHPVTVLQKELENIFANLGFTIADGPEVESDYYCFQALNIPSTHPARDMQDTFFTTSEHVMRTQTSAVQARSLEKMSPPFRIVAAGRCFRCERVDAFHSHTFYQMEGMMVDKNITVGHLLYFMKTLLREIFGVEQKVRLRPGYFPFVEPGFELDIWYANRWVELLPCGLVHPQVLRYGGLDPQEWQGFAFGLGLSRLAMSRYKIPALRFLDDGDVRFIKQFPRILPKGN